MNHSPESNDRSLNDDVLAIHVVRHLTSCQLDGRAVTLADLTQELGVRKVDLRRVVSGLHAQGFVDALRLRPTLTGFALGMGALATNLQPVRKEPRAQFKLTVAA